MEETPIILRTNETGAIMPSEKEALHLLLSNDDSGLRYKGQELDGFVVIELLHIPQDKDWHKTLHAPIVRTPTGNFYKWSYSLSGHEDLAESTGYDGILHEVFPEQYVATRWFHSADYAGE